MPQIVANRVLRAVYSERQLQEVMVDFWQNHFNVFAGKAAVRWYIPSYERDVLRQNALGNFKDLLVGTATAPGDAFLSRQFPIGFAECAGARQQGQNAQQLQQMIRSGGQLPPQARERHEAADWPQRRPDRSAPQADANAPDSAGSSKNGRSAASTRTTPAS